MCDEWVTISCMLTSIVLVSLKLRIVSSPAFSIAIGFFQNDWIGLCNPMDLWIGLDNPIQGKQAD
jgi:hypothetical protein